jgi:hypothetical protein
MASATDLLAKWTGKRRGDLRDLHDHLAAVNLQRKHLDTARGASASERFRRVLHAVELEGGFHAGAEA